MQRQQWYKQRHWSKVVRQQVLYNYDYRCAHCNTPLPNTGVQAQVHHIVELKRAPRRGFDLTNLEPLCIRCHNKTHGRGNRGGVYGCDVDGSPRDPAHPWNRSA
jgi:5-methylcytosine-specific restriction protein A